ncbi:unnamed protein product [Camellia sinensis]
MPNSFFEDVKDSYLRVSFTVCVWESYTEIFSGQRKSQKMARNSAQGEKQHSGASTASTSASAAIRVRSRPDPFLVICRCFSIVTSATAILCISVNILSAIHSFKDGSDIFDGIFRCYAVVIAMFVVVAETEWGFIKKFWKVLEYWAARDMLQIDNGSHFFFQRRHCSQFVERAGSIIPTASLAGTEVSVDEIRSATASSDRYYPPLHAPLISSPEPDPNEKALIYQGGYGGDYGANNLIPMEIALKIAEKIKARERFVAYIVIPMWPEGNPTSAATQKILFWQNKTMQMMYETIYKALVEVGLQNEYTPQDYLNLRSYLESTEHPYYVHTMEEAMATARWKKWRDVDLLKKQMETYCENGLEPWTPDKLPYPSDKLGGDSLVGLFFVAMAHALVVAVMISAGSRISGGHLNPAVTLGLCVGGHITVFRSILYWINQLLAFAAACALLKYLTGGLVNNSCTYTSQWNGLLPRSYNGDYLDILIVVLCICALCGPKKGFLDGLGPLLVGLVVGANIMAGGPFSGASMNPERSFGPALVSGNWTDHWVYWVGPLIGGGLAGLIYENFFIVRSHVPLPREDETF